VVPLAGSTSNGYGTYPVVGRSQFTDYVGRLDGTSLVTSRQYNDEELGGDDEELGRDGTVPRVSAIPVEFDDLRQRGDMYATPRHGSLQNARTVLDYIVGRVNDLYTQFDERPPPQE
jgi:hypothetical protein